MDEQQKKEDDYRKNLINEMADKAEWEQKFYEQTLHELQTEERFVNYFKGFRPETIETFMRFYASSKVSWYKYAGSQKTVRDLKNSRWIQIAEYALLHIQEKKQGDFLMDWLSEKVSSPHMQIFYDYTKFSDDPLNSPLVPPVSEEEVNLFLDFYDGLSKINEEEEDDDEEKDEDDYAHARFSFTDLSKLGSDWNDFVNNYYGKSRSRQTEYSNPRIQKQTFYLGLVSAKEKAEEEEKEKENKITKAPAAPPAPAVQAAVPPAAPKPYVPDKRPFLHEIRFNENRYAQFIEKFDNRETLRYFKIMKRIEHERAFMEQVENDLRVMEEAKEFIPISSHDDWREAVKIAAEDFARRKVRKAITDVWKMYCEDIEAGRRYESLNKRTPHFDPAKREYLVQRIIQGRVLNGEPPDLNY